MLLAQRQDRDDDRHADESAGNPPHERPEEHRKQHQEGRNRQRAARDARFEIASDQELNEIEAGEYDHGHLPGFELRDREQGREDGGDQRPHERDIVQQEGDEAPFRRQRKPDQGGEAPDQDARYHAHQAPDQHKSAKLDGGFGSALQHDPAELANIGAAQLGGNRVDLEQAEDDIDQHHQRKGEHPVQADRCQLKQTDQPADVEVLGPKARQHDAMTFKPLGQVSVHELEASGIVDDVTRDPPEAPGNQRTKYSQDRDRDQHGHGERDELRQPCLQSFLNRPQNGYRQQGERQRREDGGGKVERTDDKDGGAKPDRYAQRMVARHISTLTGNPGRHRPATSPCDRW